MFTSADPARHVQWYLDLGCNTIQTFCVSFNGYAWYSDSAVAPVNPGLERRNFLAEVCRLAHRRNLAVMGYFTFGNNPVWEARFPELGKQEGVDYIRIPASTEWLDYFCRQVVDALKKTEVDGFMVDWVRPVQHKVWVPVEKRMWKELMEEDFPVLSVPLEEEVLEFDRRAMARAWRHIRQAVQSVRPALIWTNHPFIPAERPLWEGHVLLKEVDWVLNEDPDLGWLEWLSRQVGPHTTIVQNLCGWATHDAAVWEKVDTGRYGLYGFAQADPESTFPIEAHRANIETIRTAYARIAG